MSIPSPEKGGATLPTRIATDNQREENDRTRYSLATLTCLFDGLPNLMPSPINFLLGSLRTLERLGNRLPHPSLLFLGLCGIVAVLSAVAHWFSVSAQHPLTGTTIMARTLLSRDGISWWLQHAVANFTGFAPVGTVLVAMLGIGVAERSGLLGTVLRGLVLRAPPRLLSTVVVFAGVLSSIAADAGYVVLVPLAGLLFQAAGRNPLVGIAAAFAGVSGGYSANLVITPLDAIIAGISTEAARLVASDYTVDITANYYFLIASTFLVTAVGAWVTEFLIAPHLDAAAPAPAQPASLTRAERDGLCATAWFSVVFMALLLWGLLPASGVLRGPDGSLAASPALEGIVVLLAIYAALAGVCYGRASGTLRSGRAWIEAMEASMAGMASYLVLMFFAAQFVNAFGWTQLGSIAAIGGAEALAQLNPGPIGLVLGLIAATAIINLLIGSASAKWALMAPIFVPMLYLLGLSPEATQMAFRIGDSTSNLVTPLMPYFGVVVAFAQRHDKQAGVGTIMAVMVPYTLCLLLAWSGLLALWVGMDWALGPGAGSVRTG